jgi:hypothetical protein
MDEFGLAALSPTPEFAPELAKRLKKSRKKRVSIELSWEKRRVVVPAILVRGLRKGRVAGLRFRRMTSDRRKELNDFFEELRGAGSL